ncbi:hypothetical protein BH20VER1_BH20VER1_06620 [soil metagenome]
MGYCHCNACRRYSGAPVGAFTRWKADNVKVTTGEEFLADFRSPDFSRQRYCTSGGSFASKDAGMAFPQPAFGFETSTAFPLSRATRIAGCAFVFYQEAMTTITCKIPEEVDARLEAAARQRRVPKSQIVREALAASLRRKEPKVSAFDLIKDACGIVKGGPTDFASHPRHLKGFGQV